MRSGIKQAALLSVDGKGRVHIPLEIRRRMNMKNQVMVETEKDILIMKSVKKIEDPIAFLSSLNIKTRKTPVEMKREAELVFS